MTRRLLAAPLVVLLLAAGCGEQRSDGTATDAAAEPSSASAEESTGSSESPSESADESPEPPPEPPRCDRVWVAEGSLSWDYRGCLRAGRLVKADRETCTNGQVLVRFDDRYYGVLGGKVLDEGDLRSSERYKKALRACHG